MYLSILKDALEESNPEFTQTQVKRVLASFAMRMIANEKKEKIQALENRAEKKLHDTIDYVDNLTR